MGVVTLLLRYVQRARSYIRLPDSTRSKIVDLIDKIGTIGI